MITIVLTVETVTDVRDRLLHLLAGKQYRHQMFDPSGQEQYSEAALTLADKSFAADNAPIYFHDRTGGIVLHLTDNLSTDQAFVDGSIFIFDDASVTVSYDRGFKSVFTVSSSAS